MKDTRQKSLNEQRRVNHPNGPEIPSLGIEIAIVDAQCFINI